VIVHLYHLAQQKLRYEIVKIWSRNTQKRIYFNLKISSAAGGFAPQTPMASSGRGSRRTGPRVGFLKLFLLQLLLLLKLLSKFLRSLLGGDCSLPWLRYWNPTWKNILKNMPMNSFQRILVTRLFFQIQN